MEFRDLYHFCDATIASRKSGGERSVILVSEIKDQLVAGVSWLGGINIYAVDCQEGDPHGHYECFCEAESRWEDPDSWVALITYDRTLNVCRRRFVWCKEMMHIFDTEDGQIRDADSYKGLLGEIEMQPLEQSEAYDTENFAKWKALLLLCPKSHRDQLIEDQAKNPLTPYRIALDFRIPESVVPSLFSTYYDRAYEKLISS